MSVFHNNALIGAGGGAGAAAGDVGLATRSLRFNSAYLHRTPSSAGNLRTHTFAAWVKRSALGGRQTLFRTNTSEMHYSFAESAQGNEDAFFCYGGAGSPYLVSKFVYRDTSAWFHLCVAWDTTQSTSTDRLKLYINGVRQESWKTSTFPSQNFEGGLNKANKHGLGANSAGGEPLNGYLADVYFIDGSALSPVDNFIELDTNGVYQAKEYSGTFGTNGFHLPFSDATSTTTIAADNSGNGNNFTASGISVTAGSGNDSLFDSPKNGDQTDSGAGGEVSGNYCTLNPLTSSNYTLSNGNLDVGSGSGGNRLLGTIGVSSGKYYFEAVFNSHTSSNDSSYLVVRNEDGFEAGIRNRTADTQYFTSSGGNLGTYSSSNWSTSETHGFALDCDNNQLKIYKNNTLTATISITAGKTYFPGYFRDGSNGSFTFNFGARAFTYAAPSGFKALCTTNLPTPTIANGSAYFDTKLWTGNSPGTQTISGFEFSPDFVWIKNRSSAKNHAVLDIVRGGDKVLKSNTTDTEDTASNFITSFTSDGFAIGNDSAINESGKSIVGWAWDAGSSTVSNTDGSITSNVRANQTAGFSIVTYSGNSSSGATVGHGLGAVPELIILRARNRADGWATYNGVSGSGKYLVLETTAAVASSTAIFNGTPTSTVFQLGNDAAVNGGFNYVAYCFAPVANYSAIGSYSGNSSTDGAFVHTGFRPAWLMVKSLNATGSWSIFDYKRDPENPLDKFLFAEQNFVEQDSDTVDFLSNGFKFRTGGGDHNFSGRDYLYLAFAESPLQANGGLAR